MLLIVIVIDSKTSWKKLILVSRNRLLSQEVNSWHKKLILVTRNSFLPQEINSCHKKTVLVNSHPLVKLFYQFATTRESYQKIRLSFYISWEPGSQVPRENAALISIQHEYSRWNFNMNIQDEHSTWTFNMNTQDEHSRWTF